MFAQNDVMEMTKRGVPGVWTYGFYDGWTPNYMFYAVHTHNATGRFYEVGGYGVNNVTPRAAAPASAPAAAPAAARRRRGARRRGAPAAVRRRRGAAARRRRGGAGRSWRRRRRRTAATAASGSVRIPIRATSTGARART